MANINKNIIMQAGAAVANATNKAAGLSAATPEPGSIISAIQLVNGGRTIGPDALAHFTESVRNKLLSLLVTMEPIQDLHGYENPWPAGGGKNKVDVVNFDVSTISDNQKIIFDNALTPLVAPFHIHAVYSTEPDKTSGMISVRYTDQTTDSVMYYKERDVTVTKDVERIVLTNWSSATGVIEYLQVESGTSFTSFAPYANICPLTGRTGANAYVSPTPNVADATTYTADWTTPAGTIYGGSADIVTGDIKAAPYYASYNGETLVGPWVSSMNVYDPEGTPTTGAQVVDLGGTMTEYHITGQDIITLMGDNYIWSDSGDVTITE